MISVRQQFLIFLGVLSIVITSCGGLKDQEGKEILILKIGSQLWMAENLNVSHFRNGDVIPEARTTEEWVRFNTEGKPAWCYENNEPESGKKYGKLYNWFAVTDPGGLAPKGMHISTDEEWTKLTTGLGGGMIAAMALKAAGGSGTAGGAPQQGFSGLPGGNRGADGSFYGTGSYGYWWTSTEMNPANGWMRILNYEICDVKSVYYNKGFGFSVRCLRD